MIDSLHSSLPPSPPLYETLLRTLGLVCMCMMVWQFRHFFVLFRNTTLRCCFFPTQEAEQRLSESARELARTRSELSRCRLQLSNTRSELEGARKSTEREKNQQREIKDQVGAEWYRALEFQTFFLIMDSHCFLPASFSEETVLLYK